MAKRILVPVDRTAVSENVVAIAADLARAGGAMVRLLHVAAPTDNVETREGRVVAYADQEMARLEAEHTEYLRSLAEIHLSGVPTECVVGFGHPASEILAEIRAFDADLLVVATRTRSSLTRVLLGSVAEELLRQAPITVLLVRPR